MLEWRLLQHLVYFDSDGFGRHLLCNPEIGCHTCCLAPAVKLQTRQTKRQHSMSAAVVMTLALRLMRGLHWVREHCQVQAGRSLK